MKHNFEIQKIKIFAVTDTKLSGKTQMKLTTNSKILMSAFLKAQAFKIRNLQNYKSLKEGGKKTVVANC